MKTYHNAGVCRITDRRLLSSEVSPARNANQTFPALLRMAHDRHRLRPARPGRRAVLLWLFGVFPASEPGFGIEPGRATSLVFSLARAQGAFESPVAGYFLDRFGPRPLIMMAITMTSIGHMLLSGVHSYIALLLVYTGVVSLSFHAGFMDAPMVIANNWFIRKRTMAMAVISASIGLGGFLVTPLLAHAIHTWGWRRAAFANGIIFLVVGLPLALLVRRSPESMGLRPDGDPSFPSTGSAGSENSKADRVEVNFTLAEALRTATFWLLTIGTGLRIAALSAMTVHYVPIMVWKGLSEQRAAFLLGAQAFLSLPSHMVFGWMADRVNKPRLMAACMLLAIVGLFFLMHAESE